MDKAKEFMLENKILKIVKETGSEGYENSIRSYLDIDLLLALSRDRSHVIDWLPIKETDTVLEINGHFGEITQFLSEKKIKTDALVTNNLERKIISARCRDSNNINIYDLEAFDDLSGVYDWIIFSGDLDYTYDEFLSAIRGANGKLSECGHIVIAMDNRFALKFLSGARDEIGNPTYGGLINRKDQNRIGFSKNEIETILQKASINDYKFFYPEPDYRFVQELFCDEFIPSAERYFNPGYSYKYDRYQTFDDSKIMSGLITEGQYGIFASSFIVITGENECVKNMEFLHYSDHRKPEFRTQTIVVNKHKCKEVIKKPYSSCAAQFVSGIYEKFLLLNKEYESINNIEWNTAELGESNCVKLDYLEGDTMDIILDELLRENKVTKWTNMINLFFDKLSSNHSMKYFSATEEFSRTFGDAPSEFENRLICLPVSDIDCIFSNVYVQGNVFTIADYEWTFCFPIPFDYIKYRCLHYYFNSDIKRLNRIGKSLDEIMMMFEINREDISRFDLMEKNFQNYVVGNNSSTYLLYNKMERKVIKEDIKIIGENIDFLNKNIAPKVYLDKGEGFTEENSFFPKYSINNGLYSVTINRENGISRIRLDPASIPGLISIVGYIKDDKNRIIKIIPGNMKRIGEYIYEAENNDPYIILVPKKSTSQIYISYKFDLVMSKENLIRFGETPIQNF